MRRARWAADPLSFLHVSRAEIDLPPGTSPYADEVYARAKANFARLRATAPLTLEDAPSVYVYRLTHGRHTQTGVAACFAIDEYEGAVIKRHELTRVDKEDDRTRHLVELARADRAGVPDVPRVAGRDRYRRRRHRGAAALRLPGRGRRDARGVACARSGRSKARCGLSPQCPRCTSPTGTTAPASAARARRHFAGPTWHARSVGWDARGGVPRSRNAGACPTTGR
jgi:hypothetical protein